MIVYLIIIFLIINTLEVYIFSDIHQKENSYEWYAYNVRINHHFSDCL